MSSPVTIGVVGASWRAEYFLRIARDLPERFTVARVLVRSDESAERVQREWDVAATTSMADFLTGAAYDYVVVSTPWAVAPEITAQLAAAGIPVLTETPPAPDLPGLVALYEKLGAAPVQVAEQYQYQPHHAARLSVARSGLLGEVQRARVSVAHGYHGISLIRLALGVGFDPVAITAHTTVERMVTGRGRGGWAPALEQVEAVTTTAHLDFGRATAEFDFNGEQYFSPIRSRQLIIAGSHGELVNDEVAWLTGPGEPRRERLYREATGIDGDLEGSYLRRILLRDTAHFENRFAPARLGDDELAVAEVMHRMAVFVQTGESFYSLAEASHDHYLGMLVDEAGQSGETLHSGEVPWA
jgi:predicted dehydrogenase